MIAFYFFLAGTAIGWVIGFAHRLDRNERPMADLPTALVHRHVSNEFRAAHGNRKR